jgi:aconitase A
LTSPHSESLSTVSQFIHIYHVVPCAHKPFTVDANAQMALLQFISAGIDTVRVPTSVHADHLITAKHGDRLDLAEAEEVNREVYKFLESACAKVGFDFGPAGGDLSICCEDGD